MAKVACGRCGLVYTSGEMPTYQAIKDLTEPGRVLSLCIPCWESYRRWRHNPGRYPGDTGYTAED